MRRHAMSHSKKPTIKNMDFYHIFALNLSYYRRQSGYTQVMLAEIADISPSYLSSLESVNHVTPCSLEVLCSLAHALNIAPYQLLVPLAEDS